MAALVQELTDRIGRERNGDAVAAVESFTGDVNGHDYSGFTPLYHAVFKGNLAAVSALVLRGAGIAVRVRTCDTPLHGAARLDNGTLALLLHLFPDVDINMPDGLGRTPLHWAVLYSRHDNMVQLLKHGADAGIEDCAGRDAEKFARSEHRPGALQLLLRWTFGGLRADWLRACAAKATDSDDCDFSVAATDATAAVVVALDDRSRVSIIGDGARSWLLGSVYGGMVARFLDAGQERSGSAC